MEEIYLYPARKQPRIRAWKLLATLLAFWLALMAFTFFYNLPAWCAKPETRSHVAWFCK